MLKAKLVVVGGEASEAEVDLRLPTVIGRGREVTLTVPHALVSRRHAEIFEQDGQLFVRDLGSLNGTFVNNQKIEAEHPLNPDQLLTLGNITFRAVYEFGCEIDDTEIASAIDTAKVKFDELETSSDTDDPFDRETVPVDSLNQSRPDSDTENQSGAKRKEHGAASVDAPEDSISGTACQPVVSRSLEAVELAEAGSAQERDSSISQVIGSGETNGNPAGQDESEVGSFLRRLPK